MGQTIRPILTQLRVPVIYDRQHEIDYDRVDSLLTYLRESGCYNLRPVLVLEDEGNGVTVLDGHHRLAAVNQWMDTPDRPYDITTIPVYVICVADYCRLLDSEFGGCAPSRLVDLDDFIEIDGASYDRS